MSLSPYVQVPNLNGALQSGFIAGQVFYPDALDKRSYGGGIGQYIAQARDIVDTVADVSDTIANARGVRSPLYTIGQIVDIEKGSTMWRPDATTGLMRAVTSLNRLATSFGATESTITQLGVIIDGIGEVAGEMSVDFSTNPSVYLTKQIVDNRVRVPTRVTMTVLVSNYMNDDIKGTALDMINNFDPTGFTDTVKNYLAADGYTRAQSKLYLLRNLMENGKPFELHTPHGIYSNMLIKSIRPRTDDKKMDMLYCDIEFREVIMYAPYGSYRGNQPARRGTDLQQAGWTQKAVNKTQGWVKGFTQREKDLFA